MAPILFDVQKAKLARLVEIARHRLGSVIELGLAIFPLSARRDPMHCKVGPSFFLDP
jgi:hypothetical protein